MRIPTRLTVTLGLAATSTLGAGGLLGACSSSSTSADTTTTSTTSATASAPATGEFKRTILAQSPADNAPGQTLYLQKVDFGPHAETPIHHHEGLQESTVLSGDLTYSVVTGSAGLRRASGATSTIDAGSKVVLHAGDTLIEYQTTVHQGANDTNKVVSLMVTSLLAAEAPLSTNN